MYGSLIGTKITIQSNDFINQNQNGVIVTIDPNTDRILLRLDEPFKYGGATYTHVVASPRLSRDNPILLEKDGFVGCSLTWVPDSKFNIQDPLNLTWWRGGAVGIADVCVRK